EIEMLEKELMTKFQQVLRSTSFILGPNVKAFEEEVGKYLTAKHSIGLNSGTDGLIIALRALEVGPGDEVITSPFTFFATGEAISLVGATPVFCDIEPGSMNINATQIEKLITPKTKAIIPVHLFGHAADMDPIMALAKKNNLKVIEDTCQAIGTEYKGRKVGTIGDIGAYSFFPSKNLGAYGDGGLMTTNDDKLARLCRMLRVHGSEKRYFNEMVGYNSRLDEIQAMILRVKLPILDKNNDARRKVAAVYNDLFKGVSGVTTPTEASYTKHVYHQYTIRIAGGKRDHVNQTLAEMGITTMIYYPNPMHKLSVYKHLKANVPETDKAAAEVLSLPIWPQITSSVQATVVKAIANAIK
ncbi:MAG: DegT/DnrJ/EryC1/StrS family aminotransferase, partial [Bdellovibrionia bacterium]